MSARSKHPSSAESDPEQVLRAVVRRVTFRNPENGYSVLQVVAPEIEGQFTVVGTSLDLRVGANFVARGVFKDHPKFGRQFQASSITESTPSSPEGLETYLGSGLIKGIGPKTAQRIVEEFGAETMEVIYRDPDRLAKIPGIGSHKAKIISRAFAEQSEMREVMRFLVEHNIPTGLSARIYERFGARAVEILSHDPYLLAREMRGVGFATADSIAANLGIKPDAPQRLKAGIYFAVEKAADEGHTCLSTLQLVQRSKVLLGCGDEIDLGPPLEALLEESYLVQVGEHTGLRHLWRAEDFVAEFIADRCAPRAESPIAPALIDQFLDQAGGELGLTFSEEQRRAVHLATQHRLMIITGGPGCGKTTVTRALVSVFKNAGKGVLLAAPTGRAAQRMAQVCGTPASTIHRLLRYDPSRNGFLHGPNEPLIGDVVIIDEASMIDVGLARDLFSAIPREATLILVGDKDQLPSVGPGRVFGDLIAVPAVRTIALSQLFRRAEESSINRIAFMINAGSTPDIPEPDGVTRADAYFIPRSDAEEAAEMIEKLMADQIPRKFGIESGDITVLTPSNRGPLGTIALNARLQHRLNPSGAIDVEQELEINHTHYRVGDRVCQRVNNYQIDPYGVFNGDMGRIYSVSRAERSLVVEMWDGRLVKYDQSDIGQLSHAYAITVHRSQGSEIPCVILGLHDSHYTLLERQLIYTGVTRARKLLIVVGSRRALHLASKRTSARRRQTRLVEAVEAALRRRAP